MPAVQPDPPPSPLTRLHLWHIQAVRDLLVIAAVVALVWFGYALRAVTVPLLVALLLAYLFEPLIAWLAGPRLRLRRPFAIAALLGLGCVFAVGVLTFAVPIVFNQSMELFADVREGRFLEKAQNLKGPLRYKDWSPAYQKSYDDILKFLHPGPDSFAQAPPAPETAPEAEPSSSEPVTKAQVLELIRQHEAAQAPAAAQRMSVYDVAREAGRRVLSVLGALLQMSLLAFLIPFYFFFFSMAWPSVLKFGRGFLPRENRPRMLELLGKMDRAVAGFVRGRIVICFLMGLMLAIGWYICGVPYAILLGFFTGALAIVPYLSGVGMPVAVALLFFNQASLPEGERMVWWAVILWPTVVYLIVQAIETYVLTPMIAGKATNLDPVTIVVAVIAGGSIAGAYGMLLAIPVAACAKIIVTDVIMPKIRAWSEGRAADPLPINRG